MVAWGHGSASKVLALLPRTRIKQTNKQTQACCYMLVILMLGRRQADLCGAHWPVV